MELKAAHASKAATKSCIHKAVAVHATMVLESILAEAIKYAAFLGIRKNFVRLRNEFELDFGLVLVASALVGMVLQGQLPVAEGKGSNKRKPTISSMPRDLRSLDYGSGSTTIDAQDPVVIHQCKESVRARWE